jgi:hypothetical protein
MDDTASSQSPRDVYDEDVQPLVAHIGGIPVEETVAMAVPVIGAAYAALVPSVRARWRLWKRKIGRS